MVAASDNVHIHAPHLLSRRRRIGDTFMTGLMWLLYSYLWAPFISLMAWLLGFEFAYDVMVRAGGLETLKQVLWGYGIIIAVIFVVVAGWAATNRYRFATQERRLSADETSDTQLTEYFGLDAGELHRMRYARIARISFNATEGIEQIDIVENETDQRDRRDQKDLSEITKAATNAR